MLTHTVLPLSFYSFRIVIIASIVSIPYTVFHTHDWSRFALSCGACIHHVYSAFSGKYFYQVVDLILVSFEIAAWGVLSRGEYALTLDPWSERRDLILAMSLYCQILGLCVLWAFRIAALVETRGCDLFKPFDLQSGCSQPDRSRWTAFIGRKLWQARYRQEPRVVRALRALLSIGFMSIFIIFSFIATIVEPVGETGLTPAQNFHSTSLVSDFTMDPPVWNIIAFIDMRVPVASEIDKFKAAINVTPLWDIQDRPGPTPECVHIPGAQTFLSGIRDVQSNPNIQTITIFCPSRLQDRYLSLAADALSRPSSLVSPDLLITVNFSTLGMSSNSLVDARQRTVSLLVGLTNNTADVLASTVPTPLFPGSHLCGSVSRKFRKRFVKPSLASLGISSMRTFLVTDLVALATDPSPLIPHEENMATLRVYGQNDPSEWTFLQDTREKTVLGGFAAVGGFWTSINGIFAFIFGSSLLLVAFGVKPLSAVGILDLLQSNHLREAWYEDYPYLDREANLPPDKRGHLTFIRDHLIDFGPIGNGDRTWGSVPLDAYHGVQRPPTSQ